MKPKVVKTRTYIPSCYGLYWSMGDDEVKTMRCSGVMSLWSKKNYVVTSDFTL